MKILTNFLQNITIIAVILLVAMTCYFLVISFIEWEWSVFPNPFTWDAKLTRILILVFGVTAFLHSFDVDYDGNDDDDHDLGPL